VDSSVAALRLRDAGEPIAGLFMQNWATTAAATAAPKTTAATTWR
jgi:tRNA-specific 2-thiouridylase